MTQYLTSLTLVLSSIACAQIPVTPLIFKRAGGFVGFSQKLEIQSASGAAKAAMLSATDKKRNISVQRPLSHEETATLSKLIAAAQKAPATVNEEPGIERVSDAFSLSIFFEGETKPRLQLRTLAMPYVDADGKPWSALLTWLDAKLIDELRKESPRPPNSPK